MRRAAVLSVVVVVSAAAPACAAGGGRLETAPPATTPATAPEAAPAARDRLPPALIAALETGDPRALAETSLPRLADLAEAGALADLAERLALWPVDRRVAAYAFLAVGAPYRLGPLGEGAPPDTDPLVRFDVFDCATLNLTAEALAHAPEAGGVEAAMARANYRDGVVSHATRLHFTTDRLDASPYDADLTRRAAERMGIAVRTRRVTLNRKPDGSRWIAIDWEREREVAYIPIAAARRLADWYRAGAIPDAIGVALVRERFLAQGLDVVHETLLWRGETLLHGSSAGGRVVVVPWVEYLAAHEGRYDGVVLFEYR